MRIINLIENTEGVCGCISAHGLSFYIETEHHKLLVDLGPSDETIKNADKLGIDLGCVDTVVLSHGHYDHSGGILPFAKINSYAKIYMQKSAGMDFYADDGEEAVGERYRYIGIDKQILKLGQVTYLNGNHRIDDELELFVVNRKRYEVPSANRRLLTKNGSVFSRDVFEHEQYLVIRSDNRRILVSGCAHVGILNIMNTFMDRYGAAPDMVVSGFHLMKKTGYTMEEYSEISDIAEKLMEYPTKYFTCHCTGLEAYEIMKGIMGAKLAYVHSGETVL